MTVQTKKLLHSRKLIVNGVERVLLVTGEESLADLIRGKMGLTGTKVGCRANQCGICTVLLNDKPIRSCVTKAKQLRDTDRITTIEGIGTPEHLHPLQMAWIKYGGAQCGICTPGFIVSAYGLLLENPAPTRGEVREWFRTNRNACRCTGYKPLVDAVMAAARVMRGEAEVDSLGFHIGPDGRIFGTDYPRPSAIAKVTGTCEYGADTGTKLPAGTLRLALVQAKVSHANILNIDTTEAEKMPGVEAVLTYKDVKGSNRIDGLMMFPWGKADGLDRPVLCDKKVFQYGDAVAIVCADTQEHANAAVDKVVVAYEKLPAYLNAYEAAAEDAIEIHPGTPNVFFEQHLKKGNDPDAVFQSAAAVVEHEYYSQRQPHLPLEPDVGYAYYDEQGRVTICSKSVALYTHKAMIAKGIGVENDQLRMIQNNAGGTFGYKLSPTMEAILGVAVIATGKPVHLEFSMEQQITYTGKRSPMFIKGKLAADKDGKILGLATDILCDHGAYSEFGDLLITKPLQFVCAGYDIKNIRGVGRVTFTNHAYGAAMRAYGSPQAYFAGESLVDELAEKLHMDPFEFRYKNLYDVGSTTPTGNPPEVLVMKQIFDSLRPVYEKACMERNTLNEGNGTVKRGVGISVGIYCCSGCGDVSHAAAELLPDGKIAIYHTWEDHGQGADMGALASAHEALKELHQDVTDIVLIPNDTAKCVDSGYAAGSRSQIMVGNAIYAACQNLITAMRKEDGSFRTYAQMKENGLDVYYEGTYSVAEAVTPMDPNTMQHTPYPAYMYSAYIAQVDVNLDDGKTQVVRMTGSYDIGKIANRTVVEGQVYGGMLLGIGMALSEDFEDFEKQTTLHKCGFPTIDMVPDELQIMFTETPRPNSVFGCAGVGEVVNAGPHAAITNAIANATGARIYTLPAYPERVLAAINEKRSR